MLWGICITKTYLNHKDTKEHKGKRIVVCWLLVVRCWVGILSLLVVGCSLVPRVSLGTPVSEVLPRVCVNYQQVTGGSRGEWPFAPTKAFPVRAWEREDSAPLPPCSSAPLLLCSSAPLLLCSSAPLLPCPFLLSRSPDCITAAFPWFKGVGKYKINSGRR